MAKLRVTWRAAAVVWAAHAQRARVRLAAALGHHAPALLVALGLGGALGGGALVGEWCLGLVLIAESAGAVAVGLSMDDGNGPPRGRPRTVEDVLERARLAP